MPDSFSYEQPGRLNVNCHSRYAPGTEARRHLDTTLAGREPALVFILGAGRNYLGQELRRALPGATAVVLQASTDFDCNLIDPGDLYWSPGSPYPLETILNSALGSGKAAGGVAIIEWAPASRGCKPSMESIRDALRQALERYAAESATTGYWGKRWLRNCVDFVCGEGALALPFPASGPVAIACAGPGLHDSIAALRRAYGNFRLWSLASAQQALMIEGLEPELVISTDPGFWNGAHLAIAAQNRTFLAATPSSRLGSAILDGRTTIVPVCTGLGFELDALTAVGGIQGIKALPSGTAAGTALSIAITLGYSPIYLCGFDLAAHGLTEHASPYAFDLLDEIAATRLHPVLSTRFHRVMDSYTDSIGAWRLSRAFTAYALDTAPTTGRNDIFRISKSPVETRMKCINPDCLPTRHRTADSTARDSGDGTADGGNSTILAGAQLFQRKQTRGTRRKDMMDLLEHRAGLAIGVLKDFITARLPIPRETVLELLAFGGKDCAATIAKAARGEADKNDIQDTERAVRSGLTQLSGGAA